MRRLCAALAGLCVLVAAGRAEAQPLDRDGPLMIRPQGPASASGLPPPNPRHRLVLTDTFPDRYRTVRNPLSPTPENLELGAARYAEYCAKCHGPDGRGDGRQGRGLAPPPADLRQSLALPIAFDGFLFWTIAEGGAVLPAPSAMPVHKKLLKPDTIWAVILHMRTRFGP